MRSRLLALVLLVAAVAGTGSAAPPAARPPAPLAPPTQAATEAPVAALPFPAPRSGVLPVRTRRQLQAVLDGVVADWRQYRQASLGAPGITAAVVSAAGSWSGAAGSSGTGGSGDRLVPEAMMAIASITKTFTAAEVVTLAGRGLIDLDQPASVYLNHPLLARRPTVRQLLSMTSGIPNFLTQRCLSAMLAAPTHRWTVQRALTYVDEPPGEPGKKFDYSNSNYALLGLLIEKVTGLPYAAALRRDLLPGTDRWRLAIQDDEAPTPPMAAPLESARLRPDGRFLPNRAVASAALSAGSIAADATTLARWGYDLYGGRRLPPEAVSQMVTVERGQIYGLGTIVEQPITPDSGVGHGGDIVGYSSSLLVIPTRQLAVAVLVRNSIDAHHIADELRDIIISNH
jgi:D-alanyl-D-alanine carboxypeptidase